MRRSVERRAWTLDSVRWLGLLGGVSLLEDEDGLECDEGTIGLRTDLAENVR